MSTTQQFTDEVLDAQAIRVTKARIALLQKQPFFGSLVMRLACVRNDAVGTACTDGKTMEWAAQFFATLTDLEIQGVLAHEVMHCALLHFARMGSRDLEQWNVAGDYAINASLVDAGFKLPKSALIDAQYAGMSAEAIYGRLGQAPKQPGGKGQGKGQGQATGAGSAPQQGTQDAGQAPGNDPGGCGGVKPAPSTTAEPGVADQSQQDQLAEEWKVAITQAAAFAGRSTNAELLKMIRGSVQSKVDWRSILKEFVDNTIVSDSRWDRPNRRYAHTGLYLPGAYKENTGEITIALDTSVSITEGEFTAFTAEVTHILEAARPSILNVLYIDTLIRNVEVFSINDGDMPTFTFFRGGGTSFIPAFDWIAQNAPETKALIYLTDTYGAFPKNAPEYPVLWCVAGREVSVPFGQVVKLEV